MLYYMQLPNLIFYIILFWAGKSNSFRQIPLREAGLTDHMRRGAAKTKKKDILGHFLC